MIKEKYHKAVDDLFKTIRENQNDKLHDVASLMAEAVMNDNCIHIYDTGHIIDAELLNRAGGFELIKKFKYDLAITGTARPRANRQKEKSMEGLAEFALRKGDIHVGDVMVIGSVSGKSEAVVDLALACKKMGVKVVTLTSFDYKKVLKSDHSSNKFLSDIGDINLDNFAPAQDAMLDIEGLDSKFIPASGLSAAYMMWGVMADLAEILIEKGIQPGILRSVNYPGNREYNAEIGKIYQEKNY